MMLKIYLDGDTDKEFVANNANGVLSDAINVRVTRELNYKDKRGGTYELTFDYPYNGELFDELKFRSIIVAEPYYGGTLQKFRIAEKSKAEGELVSVRCTHIGYDKESLAIEGTGVERLQGLTYGLTQALINIAASTLPGTRRNAFSYEVMSDLSNYQDGKEFLHTFTKSLYNILYDTDTGLMDLYDGLEFDWDNEKLLVYRQMGSDTDFVFDDRRNAVDVKDTAKLSDYFTGGFAYWYGYKYHHSGKWIGTPQLVAGQQYTVITGGWDAQDSVLVQLDLDSGAEWATSERIATIGYGYQVLTFTPTKNLNVAISTNTDQVNTDSVKLYKGNGTTGEEIPLTGDWKDGYWLGTSDTVGTWIDSSTSGYDKKVYADHTDEAVINTKYDYSKPMIIDASDAFDSKPDGDKLYAYARKVMTPLQKDAVKNTINFTVVLDPDSEEAKTLRLGDRVRAKSIYTGTDQKVRVTKTVYNPIGRYYTEIGVGEPEKTITEAIIGVGKWGG